jgi:hypothetical protein
MDSLQQGRDIPQETLASLVEQARDFAVTGGILMIPKDAPSLNLFSHAPFNKVLKFRKILIYSSIKLAKIMNFYSLL